MDYYTTSDVFDDYRIFGDFFVKKQSRLKRVRNKLMKLFRRKEKETSTTDKTKINFDDVSDTATKEINNGDIVVQTVVDVLDTSKSVNDLLQEFGEIEKEKNQESIKKYIFNDILDGPYSNELKFEFLLNIMNCMQQHGYEFLSEILKKLSEPHSQANRSQINLSEFQTIFDKNKAIGDRIQLLSNISKIDTAELSDEELNLFLFLIYQILKFNPITPNNIEQEQQKQVNKSLQNIRLKFLDLFKYKYENTNEGETIYAEILKQYIYNYKAKSNEELKETIEMINPYKELLNEQQKEKIAISILRNEFYLKSQESREIRKIELPEELQNFLKNYKLNVSIISDIKDGEKINTSDILELALEIYAYNEYLSQEIDLLSLCDIYEKFNKMITKYKSQGNNDINVQKFCKDTKEKLFNKIQTKITTNKDFKNTTPEEKFKSLIEEYGLNINDAIKLSNSTNIYTQTPCLSLFQTFEEKMAIMGKSLSLYYYKIKECFSKGYFKVPKTLEELPNFDSKNNKFSLIELEFLKAMLLKGFPSSEKQINEWYSNTFSKLENKILTYTDKSFLLSIASGMQDTMIIPLNFFNEEIMYFIAWQDEEDTEDTVVNVTIPFEKIERKEARSLNNHFQSGFGCYDGDKDGDKFCKGYFEVISSVNNIFEDNATDTTKEQLTFRILELTSGVDLFTIVKQDEKYKLFKLKGNGEYIESLESTLDIVRQQSEPSILAMAICQIKFLSEKQNKTENEQQHLEECKKLIKNILPELQRMLNDDKLPDIDKAAMLIPFFIKPYKMDQDGKITQETEKISTLELLVDIIKNEKIFTNEKKESFSKVIKKMVEKSKNLLPEIYYKEIAEKGQIKDCVKKHYNHHHHRKNKVSQKEDNSEFNEVSTQRLSPESCVVTKAQKIYQQEKEIVVKLCAITGYESCKNEYGVLGFLGYFLQELQDMKKCCEEVRENFTEEIKKYRKMKNGTDRIERITEIIQQNQGLLEELKIYKQTEELNSEIQALTQKTEQKALEGAKSLI